MDEKNYPSLQDLFTETLFRRDSGCMKWPWRPFERLTSVPESQVFLKREDLSPIHAYKWRGRLLPDDKAVRRRVGTRGGDGLGR